MHFEILVEGQSEVTALSILLPKILCEHGCPHTWKIHKHRGIGRIPDDPAAQPKETDPTLLHNLPSKLRAYGREGREDLVVVVLVDLDKREDCVRFKHELKSLLHFCDPEPQTIFRIAIEELEAWYFGDEKALETAYPEVDRSVVGSYKQDSQCDTWETLADAVYPGGCAKLTERGRRNGAALALKRIWAKDICPHMDVDRNKSPSFQAFCSGIRTKGQCNKV